MSSVNIVKSHLACLLSFRANACGTRLMRSLATFSCALLLNCSLHEHAKRNINPLFHEYSIQKIFITHLNIPKN